MMKNELFERANEFVKRNCNADDYSFAIYSRQSHETRFAQNAITQHIAGTNFHVHFSVSYGNKTGTASINQLNEESLKKMIDTAQQIAVLNQPDTEFIATQSEKKLKEFNNYSEETAKISTEQMVEMIKKCVKNAKEKDAVVSGMTEKHISKYFFTTKNGFESYDCFTSFSHSMTMKKNEVETKVSKGVKNFSDFDIDEQIAQLNSQFDSLHKPKPFEAQKIPVILRPAAVRNLYSFLYWMMNRRDADEGVSPFSNQIGKQFFGENFSLRSITGDSSIFVPSFSSDGIVSEDIDWINKGILKNLPTTRYYADAHNLKDSNPFNFYIDGGDVTEKEMMKKVGKGLIINNFWYIRFIDKKRGELTGMTRDGVLYFEDGEIKHSVNNFRWNEVLNETTQRILSLGKNIQLDAQTRVPSMLIDNFNFVDTSSF